MSPRKSSTSSGRPRPVRPRYLGVEVAGEHFPSFARDWEGLLRGRLDRAGAGGLSFRLIRAEGRRAVVEVAHVQASAARGAWNALGPEIWDLKLATRRTFGTLVLAKVWLRGRKTGRTGRPAR